MMMEPPMDRWNLLYLTLVLHGVGLLMPWNIFINAKTVSYVSRSEIRVPYTSICLQSMLRKACINIT